MISFPHELMPYAESSGISLNIFVTYLTIVKVFELLDFGPLFQNTFPAFSRYLGFHIPADQADMWETSH